VAILRCQELIERRWAGRGQRSPATLDEGNLELRRISAEPADRHAAKDGKNLQMPQRQSSMKSRDSITAILAEPAKASAAREILPAQAKSKQSLRCGRALARALALAQNDTTILP